MVPPFFKQFFEKFNGLGPLRKTVTAIGTADQVTVTAERAGRGTGTLIHDEFVSAQGTSIFRFIVHNNKVFKGFLTSKPFTRILESSTP
jgi:hypothetical protein